MNRQENSVKKRHLHIVPVGTSILMNYGWKNGDPLPPKDKLLTWLKESPRERSAELNGLLWFFEKQQCTNVHLLATDTDACRLCRNVLSAFLIDKKINVTGVEAKDLLPASFEEARDHVTFEAAVCAFREKIFSVADRAKKRGEIVMINATAGLKSEVAVAALVAAELSVSAYYLHQSMTEPVFLPTAAVDDKALHLLRKLYRESRSSDSGPGEKVTKHYLLRREDDLLRLEREGLVKLSYKRDGEISNAKLTRYGKHILKRSSQQ